MFKRLLNFIPPIIAAAILSGCFVVPYEKCAVSQYDEVVDQENAAFVKQARDTYEARKNFRCDVELKPAESVGVFLSHASHRNFSIADKRDLLLSLENSLAARMSALRDFNLVNRGAAVDDVGVPQSVGNGKISNYRMLYSIVSMALRNEQVADPIASAQKRAYVSKTVHYGVVKIEVGLYDPSGRQIFLFNEECRSDNSDRPERMALLKQAVERAAASAIRKYSLSTMPPVYVAHTIGGGTYAQISAGAAYGITPGTKIRFFRNIVRKQPALPGEQPTETIHKTPVGIGTAGIGGAPIESDTAWVYLGDFRAPEEQSQRTVFVWTSAEPEL